MRRVSTFLGIISLLLFSGLCVGEDAEPVGRSDSDYDGIRIQPADGIFDAGTIDRNIQGEFMIENHTGKELQISNVRAGCGSCTKATWTEAPVPDRGQAYVSFELLTERVKSGPFTKYMYVSIQGYPQNVKLTITGTLTRAPSQSDSLGSLDTPRVFFGDVLPTESWERIIHLQMPDGAGELYTVESLSVEHASIRVEEIPSEKKDQWSFRVYPVLPLPLGQVKSELVIRIKNRDTGHIRSYACKIRGFVGMRLICYRMRVDFLPNGISQEERVRLSLSRREMFDVGKLNAEIEGTGVSVRFISEGTNVYAVIGLDGAAAEHEQNGTIHLLYPETDGVSLSYRVTRTM